MCVYLDIYKKIIHSEPTYII